MKFLEKLAAGACAGVVVLGASKSAGDFLYDDFSSGSLDNTKWEVRQDPEGQPLTEEYGIQNGTFTARNFNLPDRRTLLSLIGHTFQPGEELDYDVNYVSGSGNRAMVIFVDNGPLDRNNVGQIPYGGGSIGYNGQDFFAGNTFGNYHVNLNFKSGGLEVNITRPDLSLYSEFFPASTFFYGGSSHSLFPPFNVGFETWSNGSIQAEYDNVYVGEIPEAPTIEIISLGAILSLARRRGRFL